MALTGHLPSAKSVVPSVTLRLVTTESRLVLEAVSQRFRFRGEIFPLPIPNRQLLRFVVALTACGTEPLTILGKVIVASVQQIAPRALKHPPFELVSY